MVARPRPHAAPAPGDALTARELLRRLAPAPAAAAAGGGAIGVALVARLARPGPALGPLVEVLAGAVLAAALALLLEPLARRAPRRTLIVQAACGLSALLVAAALARPTFPPELTTTRLPGAVELALRAAGHPLLVWATLVLVVAPLPAALVAARACSRRLEVQAAASGVGLALVTVAAGWPTYDELPLLAVLGGALLGAATSIADGPDPRPARAAAPALVILPLALPLSFLAARAPRALPLPRAHDAPDLAPTLRAIVAAQARHVARTGRTAASLADLDLPDEVAGGYALGHVLRYARWPDGRWCVCADPVPARLAWPAQRVTGDAAGAPGRLEQGPDSFDLSFAPD